MSLFVREFHSDGRRIGNCNYCGCLNDSHPYCGACGLLLDGKRDLALEIARDAEFDGGPFCKFCEGGDLDNPPYHCDWLAPKEAWVRSEVAAVGDVWITQQAGKRGRIVEIENLDMRGKLTEGDFYQRRIWVLIPKHPKPYPYLRVNGTIFRTIRDARCNISVCELHVREVGEEVHYCQDHWRAWDMAV